MLQLQNVTLQKAQQVLINDVSLSIEAGEIVTLMGASGSGKSTLLNWLLGALDPAFKAQGNLVLNGQLLTTLPIEQRQIGILFQDDLLFPHWSVGQNLAFALPARFKGRVRRETIEATLKQIGLEGFYARDPATLSGGQRARVSVLRALLAEPKALLLDEPFAKLDQALRQQFKEFVFAQVKHLNIPVLLVTHDPQDAPDNGRIIEIH